VAADDQGVKELHVVSADRRPGPVPGAGLGAAAGLVLAATWRYGAWDVALAVTAVFLGMVAVLLAGAPGWRPFAGALVLSAGVAAGALLLLAPG
jgi:hypothetical protein